LDEFIVSQQTIQIKNNKKLDQYNRIELPEDFLLWQSSARLSAFRQMAEFTANSVRTMPAHLPVLATFGLGDFPVNLTARGIGLLPKPEWIEDFCDQFEMVINQSQEMDWEKSLPKRVEAIRNFYQHPEKFDTSLMGGLEIFEGQTYKNLLLDPRAALLYSGEAPKFPSYQINGVIKFVNKGDVYFRFLLAARELFARDTFHIHQIHYPFGYLFYPIEIKNKTPFPRR